MPSLSDQLLRVREEFNRAETVDAYARSGDYGLMPLEQMVLKGPLAGSRRLLDLGCGAGREALGGAGEGRSLVACDLAHAMCVRARRKFREAGQPWPVLTADARLLPFRNGSFDAVLAGNTILQYVPGRARRRAAIAEIHRILEPGGRVAFHLLHPGLSPTAPGYVGPPLIRNLLRAGLGFVFGGLNVLHNLWRRSAMRLPGGLEPGDMAPGNGNFAYFHIYSVGEFEDDARAAGFKVTEKIVDLPRAPDGRPARFPSLHGWDAMIVCEKTPPGS